jgi:hypothetical protein
MKGKKTYKKVCRYCGSDYESSRKHSITCSGNCRMRLYLGGYSDKKKMVLVREIPNRIGLTQDEILKGLPKGKYNISVTINPSETYNHVFVYRYINDQD